MQKELLLINSIQSGEKQVKKQKRNIEYKMYLQSPQWLLKREEVFKIKGRCCQKCKSKDNICVHHGTYERIFNEDIPDLFVLCGKCHDEYHRRVRCITVESTKKFIRGKLVTKKELKEKRLKRREEKKDKRIDFSKVKTMESYIKAKKELDNAKQIMISLQ